MMQASNMYMIIPLVKYDENKIVQFSVISSLSLNLPIPEKLYALRSVYLCQHMYAVSNHDL